MTDDPIDLSPFDPLRDTQAFDAKVAAIARDAVIPPPADLFAELAGWAPPALAAAAVVAAIASYPLVHRPSQRRVTTAEILGVPAAIVELARANTPPGVVDLAEALNAEVPRAR